MCSLKFSPVPTPKSAFIIAAAVAAAWATMAGCMRMVGKSPHPNSTVVACLVRSPHNGLGLRVRRDEMVEMLAKETRAPRPSAYSSSAGAFARQLMAMRNCPRGFLLRDGSDFLAIVGAEHSAPPNAGSDKAPY
jgi:hypothetical protein